MEAFIRPLNMNKIHLTLCFLVTATAFMAACTATKINQTGEIRHYNLSIN